MDSKTALGLFAIAISLPGYWLYIRDTFAGKTKPQMYSWLIWGLLAAVAFFGQVIGNAGAGAWVTGTTAAASLLIFVIAIFRGQKTLDKSDKFLLAIAIIAILLLILVSDARGSTTLAAGAALVAFYLTIKKTYSRPDQETAWTFALNALKFVPSFFALQTFTYLTVLYPATVMVGNAVLASFIIFRRRAISRRKA